MLVEWFSGLPAERAWLLYEGFDAEKRGVLSLQVQSPNTVTCTLRLALQDGSDAEELGLDEEWAASPSSYRGPCRATPRKTSR